MKYNSRLVMVPWIDTAPDGTEVRNWTRIRLHGEVDHRRVKRVIRKWLYETTGRRVHPIELRNILRFSSVPLYEEA